MKWEGNAVAWLRRAFTLLLAALTLWLAALLFLPRATPNTVDLPTPITSGEVESWRLGDWGFAARTERWEVYFTAPSGESDRSAYQGGLDTALVAAIDAAERAIDIAAYDFEHDALANALVAALERGVVLRIVADDSNREEFAGLAAAGIPILFDERSALMHNKFILIDNREVWSGSLNYTENGLYRNNNHILRFRQPALVAAYSAEFEELYSGDFGKRSDTSNAAQIQLGEMSYTAQFAPEYDTLPAILEAIEGAEESIRFLVFSFTLDDLGAALLQQQEAGVDVSGVFDSRLAHGIGSEYPRLYCLGVPVYLDGNPYALHHKVFIIDGRLVLTGSLNYSRSGTENNDENWLRIEDEALAAQFLAEYERVFERARRASMEECA